MMYIALDTADITFFSSFESPDTDIISIPETISEESLSFISSLEISGAFSLSSSISKYSPSLVSPTESGIAKDNN